MIKKKICFITGTRADYGILSPIIHAVKESGKAEVAVIATNMHLSQEFGMTVNEIEADGVDVDVRIESLVKGGTAASTVRSMARVEDGLAEAFEKLQPDIVVILGDRYEALAAASAAVVFNIPVAHLHGGETTEGAIDDKFRHAITQLSDYHFAATPQYAERIVSMGKPASNVFHSGAPGAECKEGSRVNESEVWDWDEETRKKEAKLRQDFYDKTGIIEGEPFILLAFHPVTMLADKGEKELEAILEALDEAIARGYKILVTMPNSDPGNEKIRNRLKNWGAGERAGKVIEVESLGSRLFHHALDTASAMIGNSSAALIEAPSHRLPAINVGIRQKGRAHGITVIDVEPDDQRIKKVVEAALSMEMKSVMLGLTVSSLNPYYKPDSASFIAQTLLSL